MKRRCAIVIGCLCAAIMTGSMQFAVAQNRRPGIGGTQPQGRNCPFVEDQVVIVSPGRPTAFKLRVFDLGEGKISIFQFPLRGILQQAGPTPNDMVFIPGENFNGSTTFSYRVIPPFDCPRNVQLGRVTLTGGTAKDTVVGLAPPLIPAPCGVGLFATAFLTAGLIGYGRRRRRKAIL